MSKPYTDKDFARDADEMIGSAVLGHHDGKLRAVGLILVDEAGTITTKFTYSAGYRAAAIAGISILQHAILARGD